jgi:hypothetical protein
LRAKRVAKAGAAKAGAAKALTVDHFRVAALVASREKVLRAAPVFETAWLTQAEQTPRHTPTPVNRRLRCADLCTVFCSNDAARA